MCGIAGVLNLDYQGTGDKEVLKKMGTIMSHRGPDGEGIFMEDNIGLVHRRLSILDLSDNASQPFYSEDGRYVIVYNGEIYNFKELKTLIEPKFIKLKSHSDTEVLLYLYMYYGEEVLNKLNGMFSFVIWDRKEKVLFAARDRMGIKPFCYSIYKNKFYFASEEKSILIAGVPKEINEVNFKELVQFRSVSGENTIYKYINKLLPGHILTIKNGNISIKKWWSIADAVKSKMNNFFSFSEASSWFYETFKSAVSYRTLSDVPVGIFISGGLDSSSVASALRLTNHTNLNSFNVKFEQADLDESRLAELVARHNHINFHSVLMKDVDIYDNIVKATWHNDQPIAHLNDPHLLYISKYSKKHVSVLLSGEGADELMGGYVRYKPLYYLQKGYPLRIIASMVNKFYKSYRVSKLTEYLKLKNNKDLVLYNNSLLTPVEYGRLGLNLSNNRYEYRESIVEEAQKLFPDKVLNQALFMDDHTYLCSLLDRNDRMTMAASVECRLPFLDYRIVESAARMPVEWFFKGKKGKYLLVQSFRKELPKQILNYKKNGFTVPWRHYVDNVAPLKETFYKMHKSDIFQSNIFSGVNFNNLYKSFLAGDKTTEIALSQFYMISIWNEHYYNKI